MASEQHPIQAGDLLLATPFMQENHFKKSVILICDHSRTEGTVGFVLNKKLDIPINDLMRDFPAIEAPLYFGGPVANDTLHYIHNAGHLLSGSMPVSEGIWWGGDFEQLQSLISTGRIGSGNIQFFVGYSGWSAGQLDGEMGFKTWMLSAMEAEFMNYPEPEELWQECMCAKGGNYAALSEMTPDKVTWS